MKIIQEFAWKADLNFITGNQRRLVYAVLIVFVLLVTVLRVDFKAVPFEDAAILMRYAENFAGGYGIVWNQGEQPVDGATDFLFMVLTGGLQRLSGFGINSIVFAVNIASHVISLLIVFYVLWRVLSTPLVLSLISVGYLILGPGAALISAQFGTPFFTMLVSVQWLVALKIIIRGSPSKFEPFGFGIFSLLIGLTRPEGVFLSFFILCTVVYNLGFVPSLRIVKSYLLIMILLGGSYFVWRWNYFGFPLPNPYYKKSSSGLDVESLKFASIYTIRFILPFLPVMFLGLIEKPGIKKLVTVIAPVLGFTLIFSLIDGSMNFSGRFQYPNLFIVAMGWWLPISKLKIIDYVKPNAVLSQRIKAIALLFLVSYTIASYLLQIKYSSSPIYKDGRYDVGIILKDYESKNLKIACSEAGLIPFISGLKTLDTWGLNDQAITHAGLVSEEMLEEFDPDLIMYHGKYSAITSPSSNSAHERMGIVLKKFAESHGFELVSNFGIDPFKSHFYYLKRGLPDFIEIKGRIKSLAYIWYETGSVCLDFTEFRRDK